MDFTSILATIVTVGLGVSLVWNKAEKILKALKELSEVLIVIVDALDDQKLTAEEIADIKLAGYEAISAFKAILKLMLAKLAAVLTSIVSIWRYFIKRRQQITTWFTGWNRRRKEYAIDKAIDSSNDRALRAIILRIRAKRKKRRDSS